MHASRDAGALQGGIGTGVRLRSIPDSSDLEETIKEYAAPAVRKVDGVSVPISIVALTDPTRDPVELISPFDWSGVRTQVATSNDPAAGASANAFQTPAGRRRLVLSFTEQMVTAIAAANRYAWVYHSTLGGAFIGGYMATRPQTASLTVNWTLGGPSVGGAVIDTGYASEPMPVIEVGPLESVRFMWMNIQGADDAGPVNMVYKEAPV